MSDLKGGTKASKLNEKVRRFEQIDAVDDAGNGSNYKKGELAFLAFEIPA